MHYSRGFASPDPVPNFGLGGRSAKDTVADRLKPTTFDKPFNRLMAMSNVEWLRLMSKSEAHISKRPSVKGHLKKTALMRLPPSCITPTLSVGASSS